MPALAFVIFALAAFARSTLAMDVADNTHELVKRRVNHADEYGYPHNRGPHVNNGKPMTPGGWVDPHPSNYGATCRSNRGCHYDAPLSVGFCNSKRQCDFTCLGDSVKSDGACVGQFRAPTCNRQKRCPRTKIAHATSVCYQRKCTFSCEDGYATKGNSCQKINPNEKCGGKSRPEVDNGYAVCQKGKWVPVCKTQLGYSPYLIDGHYECINTQNDADNCGSIGNVCPFGYNGSGTPYCKRGECYVRGGEDSP